MRHFTVAFVVIFSAVWMAAQPSATNVNYEGQTVGTVDLVSNPKIDVEFFRSLVKQPVGQPYSNQAVNDTITALRGTNRFSKVGLEVAPGPKGLEVTFVLEPAYYVGVLDFPGATKAFSYNRLLQVVNFPDQEVYDKEKLGPARDALLQFLHTNGYFQSTVNADAQLDDVHQLVNLVFTVELGKRAKVATVTIIGTDPVQTAKLLHSVRTLRTKFTGASLKPGKAYSPERIKAATGVLRKTLAKQDYLASKIQADPPQYHPETNRVDVSFNVTVGPKVVIKTTGAKLSSFPFVSSRRLRRLVPIFSEEAIDRVLVSEGRQNLIDYFQQKGFFDADVKTVFERQPDRISITYQIDKGKKHKVNEIAFSGNQAISDSDLLSKVVVKKKRIISRGKFSKKLLKASADNIAVAYQNLGYQAVKVTPQIVDADSKIRVVFQIAEGPQTLVDTLILRGNEHYPFNELSPGTGFRLRSGAPFSVRRMADDRSQISARYLDRGYLNVEVKTDVVKLPDDPYRVTVTYTITENQQVQVSQVVVLGQQHTKEPLITTTARIRPEEPLSQGRLLEGESRLYDLGIFDWSSVGPRRTITNQFEEEALVKVHESKRNSITYGFGMEIARRGGNIPSGTVAVPGLPPVAIDTSTIVSSEQTFIGPRGSIEFSRLNIRGLAETASISLLGARLDQRAIATYIDPQFRGSKQWRSLFSVSAEHTSENPLFTAREGGASFQLERTIDRKKTTTVQLRYRFYKTVLSDILLPGLVLPEDENVRLSTFSGTLIRDTRDKPLDPQRGVYQTLDLGITPTALGASADFGKMLTQYAFYRPVHSMVWANSIRLGLAKPFFDSRVPTSERFFAGGGTTLRGYPLNEAGPQRDVPVCTDPAHPDSCDRIKVPVGGNQLFILNSELRFPLGIVKNFGGVLFYDGGNVYEHISFADFVNHYTSTVGIGFRYATPVGPVRIDFGRNLNPVPGINPFQFFITLGQAF